MDRQSQYTRTVTPGEPAPVQQEVKLDMAQPPVTVQTPQAEPVQPATKRDAPHEKQILRSKTKKDTDHYQNPTFKSQILNEPTTAPVNMVRSQKPGWETTTRATYEIPIILQDHTGEVAMPYNVETMPDYRPKRQQTAEPIQTAYRKEDHPDEHCASPTRMRTYQPQNSLKEHYYKSPGKEVTEHANDLMYRYRKDDQIFPLSMKYEGDHNVIIHEESAQKLYQDNPVYRQINDERINYTDGSMRRDRANEILAAEKRAHDEAQKKHDIAEEQAHLQRLAQLEDRNLREEERRRDYRHQIDDYTKIVAEEVKDISKKQRAEMLRDGVWEEAERVKKMQAGEAAKKKAAMESYKHELDVQVKQENTRWTRDDVLDDKLEAMNTGLQIGDYREPSREDLMNTLKNQVEKKHARYEKYSKMEPTNTGDNWLGRQQAIKQWNHEFIHDHRRKNLEPRDNTRLQELKEIAIQENAKRRREAQSEKNMDVQMVNDAVLNERHMAYQEA